MKFHFLLALLAAIGCTFVLGLGAAIGQDKKQDDKTPPKKEELILGKTVGEWIKILRTHENPRFRRAALIALEGSNQAARSGLPAVLDAIEKDKDVQVRVDAVNLLGRLGKDAKPGLKALVGALQTDKSDEVREAAATAIADKFTSQPNEYVDALVQALKDSHAGTRIAVAGALRNLGENAPQAVPAMFAAAADPKENPLVRAGAVHFVSRYAKDNPKTWPLLVMISKDASNPADLRDAAVEGLGRSASDSADVVGSLYQALADKNLQLRKSAAGSLYNLGAKAKSGWPAIKPRLAEKNEPDSGVRNILIRLTGTFGKIIDEAIPALIEVAKDDRSTENRIAAIQELAELGARAKSAVPTLNTISAQDARAAIREAAGKAVAQISGK